MSATALGTALRHVHRLLDEGSAASLGDPRLLTRFAEGRDGSAFAALVERHGPMVLATCRSGLHDPGEADDAFQATFLILARRAGSVRDAEVLGGWLHRVARRVVARANLEAAARRRHEREAGAARAATTATPPADVSAALHEEIDRLPDRYRLPVVLCHLEGLTHAEAARRLRRGERTLRRHLAEALPRLRARLIRRGVALPAATLAAWLATPARAAVPEALTTLAARLPTPGVAPATAAALAGRALMASAALKFQLASAVAVGLLASACLAGSVLAVPGPDDPAMKQVVAPGPPVVAASPEEAEGAWTFAGRVLDPDGRPFAGAKLYLDSSLTAKDPKLPLRATSGPDGRFRFTLAKAGSGIDPNGGLWDLVHVAAVADGFGLGVSDGAEADADRELTVRLARDDVPIVGRLIDLQGRPIVGAAVRVESFWAPDTGDLSAWIKAARADARFHGRYNSPFNHLARTDFSPGSVLIPPVVTGADGRFRLAGIGRERLVEIGVSGPTVRKTKLTALTRPVPPFPIPEEPGPDHYPQETHQGATFELVLVPSRPIEGVVRDVESGRPIAGVTLADVKVADRPNLLNTRLTRAITGADGRYRLLGLPKGSGNVIMVIPPVDQPYLPSWKEIGDAPGLGPLTVDLALKRGVWAKGRVLDESLPGKPLRSARVSYFAASDNPRLDQAPNFRDASLGFVGLDSGEQGRTADDGTYRVAVLPGRGLLSVQVHDGHHAYGKREHDAGEFVPGYIGFDHAHRVVDIAEGAEATGLDFNLDAGRTLAGTVLDDGGEPLAGASIFGNDWTGHWAPPAKTAVFSVVALKAPREGTLEAERTLALLFRHDEKRLAGYRDLRWDEPGPLSVRLEPWGVVVGRVVDASGKPVARVPVRAFVGGGRKQRDVGLIEHKPGPVATAADGRFRLEGLASGLKYDVQLEYDDRYQKLDVPATTSGQTIDLGDIKAEGTVK